MKFFIADAFTDSLFGGNPAGVVILDRDGDFPPDETMRKTAAELRYSETAFIKVLGDREFQIRYFTPAAEVEFAVNGILQMVKKEGFRYREIALVCGDLPGYGKEISRQFEENGIPVFLDQKQEVSGNPLVRLVKCIPELLWKGFDHETMFRYLRTGLVTEDRGQLDRLDLYVRAMGIRGFSRWKASWEGTFEGGARMNLKELNEFKDQILEPLCVLKEEAGERETTAGTMTRAIVRLLESIEAERKLKEKSAAFRQAGMDREAREYDEIYGLVMELLSRLSLRHTGQSSPSVKLQHTLQVWIFSWASKMAWAKLWASSWLTPSI